MLLANLVDSMLKYQVVGDAHGQAKRRTRVLWEQIEQSFLFSISLANVVDFTMEDTPCCVVS